MTARSCIIQELWLSAGGVFGSVGSLRSLPFGPTLDGFVPLEEDDGLGLGLPALGDDFHLGLGAATRPTPQRVTVSGRTPVPGRGATQRLYDKTA